MKVLKKLFEKVKPVVEEAIKEMAKDWIRNGIIFLLRWLVNLFF
ncbi:hypothetical protein [Bdellovibrio sp. HCB-162]